MSKITLEEVQCFIEDATKARESWLKIADMSWQEIKRRNKNNQLWSVSPNGTRRRAKYPAWYSIFKIRQPLLLSRVGIPIGRDTTQDGNDNIGATAAIILERLSQNLPRNFDFFDVLSSARDDFLVTNVGQVRAYYEREEVKAQVKEYVTPRETESGVVFLNGAGEEVVKGDMGQDDTGYFVEHSETIDVTNERIILEPVFYRDFYVDPDVRRWQRCKRVAFKKYYSEREFKDIFGAPALLTRGADDTTGSDAASPKNQSIAVFEYWDKYLKETAYLIEGGSELITPLAATYPSDSEYLEAGSGEDCNGIYNLEGVFPMPDPMVMNQATDEFLPIPEYFQLYEILEDIHGIFTGMMALTRAIRPRLLFDNSVEGLQEALGEAAVGDAFGVTNLAQSLSGAGGSINGVVQYVPVQEMITALSQAYAALDQRLNTLYRLTGTSDLLQGLISDPTQRTFGERQMTEKYALNQLAEPQRKMQEFVRGCYQLMCEMALKNFKDESLDDYIMPQTMEPEHQERYRAALSLLREDTKRFRVELETDSTIALNEEYDKAMRIELVNTLTSAIEKVAAVASSSPALVGVDLHALKFLVQGFRQGKLFQQEITQAIDQVIELSSQQPAPFNQAQADFGLRQQEFAMRAEASQQKTATEMARVQVDNFEAQNDAAFMQLDLNLKAQRDQLLGQLAVLNFRLEEQKAGVEIQNKLADNQRLEALAANDITNGGTRERGPQVVVIPSPPAPAVAGPTIINAPNPAPQTSIIQPVQTVPITVPII